MSDDTETAEILCIFQIMLDPLDGAVDNFVVYTKEKTEIRATTTMTLDRSERELQNMDWAA